MIRARACLVAAASTSMLLAGTVLPTTSARGSQLAGSEVVTSWSEIALRTVYLENNQPIPAGSLYLGFTSLAVYDAVLGASGRHRHQGRASAPAAAAVAAHDVLAEYFPASVPQLDGDLAADLATLRDGSAKDRGIALGQASAARMIASRVGDGRGAPIGFTQPPDVGTWRPTPPGFAPMAVPWLGFVKPLLLASPTQIRPDGPDPLGSTGYAADFEEVRTTGSATGSTRSTGETETALFFNFNSVLQVQRGLIDLSNRRPRNIAATARLFALVNASVADALITTWRLKYDVGYWRPLTAIHEADADGNPLTDADPSWAPLVTNPPYPEYPSGHASITNAFTESLALSTGRDRTDLRLYSGVTDTTRTYTSLRTLTRDAFLARIWLGLHFRDAMEDAAYVGRESARLADRRLNAWSEHD